MLNRLCIGLLGMFPMVTAALMTVVGSLPIAAVITAMGAVTFMSFLPRGGQAKIITPWHLSLAAQPRTEPCFKNDRFRESRKRT